MAKRGRPPKAPGEALEVARTLRLHRTLLDRVAALVGPISEDPVLAPSGRASEADVIRMALGRGLEDLEDEYGRKKKR